MESRDLTLLLTLDALLQEANVTLAARRLGLSTPGRGGSGRGHEITFGVRHPENEKAQVLARNGAAVTALRQAVEESEIVVQTTP